MRIISGKYKGRRLHPPANLPVRPTTDFAKESLFNVLNNLIDFEEIRVLDLFSGTGSIALEFLSRGAIEVTAVDANHKCIEFIRKTGLEFGAINLRPVRTNSFVFIRQMVAGYDLIFADPPYDLEKLETIPDLIFTSPLLNEDGMLILEHATAYQFEAYPHFRMHRKYGSVNFSFFQKK